MSIAEAMSDPTMRQIYLTAFLAGLSVVVMCGVLSVLVVVKKLGFVGQGVSHSAFGGIGVAAMVGAMGLAPDGGAVQLLVVLAFCVAAALGMPVRWCAGPEEPLEGAVRFDDLYELACWISKPRVYIGNDSGISHLAAAVGTPVVAIFLSTDPGVWSPRGERVRAFVNPSVEAVVSAAAGLRGAEGDLWRRFNRRAGA